MSGYVWELRGLNNQCDSYAPGHQIHWIQFKLSMREPSAVIPVTALVDDDGLVRIAGDGLSLVRWNHRPSLLRPALQRFGGMAVRKPRWHILAVPTDSFMGSARSVFSLAKPDEWLACHVYASSDPAHMAAREAHLAQKPHIQKIWAEQEGRTAELRRIDYSHIPPLRVADRYAGGRRKRRR